MEEEEEEEMDDQQKINHVLHVVKSGISNYLENLMSIHSKGEYMEDDGGVY